MKTKKATAEKVEFPGQEKVMKIGAVAKALFGVDDEGLTEDMYEVVNAALFFDNGEEDEDAEEQLGMARELAKEAFNTQAPKPWQIGVSYREEFCEE